MKKPSGGRFRFERAQAQDGRWVVFPGGGVWVERAFVRALEIWACGAHECAPYGCNALSWVDFIPVVGEWAKEVIRVIEGEG